MRRFFPLLALLLLGLWFTASQHCALEAVGLLPDSCHDETQSAAGQTCADDSCAALESARYHAAVAQIAVPAPTVHEGLGLIGAALAWRCAADERAPAPATTETAHPRDWVPIWHFVRRAAPPSRAPTWLVA